MSIGGLAPGRRVSVRVSSSDARRVAFASEAVFVADSAGTVDVAAVAPVSGSYRTVDAMGLLTSMSGPYGSDFYFWGSDPQTFTVTVSQGNAQSQATFQRRGSDPGVQVHDETIAQTGFYGQYWTPAPSAPPRPAVLVFDGSAGGLTGQLQAALLASHGYPTLNLAYFAEPGLPATLANIPLEYFAGALRWLAAQPGVEEHKVVVVGSSRGGEAAELLAVDFPDLVAGMVASVPANVAVCSVPGCTGPAWTLHGTPVAYTKQLNQSAPTDNPAAVIPIEEARVPLLFDCGGADQVWHSCDYANAIEARLNAAHYVPAHPLFAYADAGHGVGELVPYEPGTVAFASATGIAGSTPDANNHAVADLWPRVLAFLDDVARS